MDIESRLDKYKHSYNPNKQKNIQTIKRPHESEFDKIIPNEPQN